MSDKKKTITPKDIFNFIKSQPKGICDKYIVFQFIENNFENYRSYYKKNKIINELIKIKAIEVFDVRYLRVVE